VWDGIPPKESPPFGYPLWKIFWSRAMLHVYVVCIPPSGDRKSRYDCLRSGQNFTACLGCFDGSGAGKLASMLSSESIDTHRKWFTCVHFMKTGLEL